MALALGCAVLAFALPLGACGGSNEESPSAAPDASPSIVPAEEPVSQWDAPGSASAAQTAAVAKKYGTAVTAEKFPTAGLYAKHATWDYWETDIHQEGAKRIASNYAGAASSLDWSKVHVLTAPGVAVDEGLLTAPGTGSTVFLTLLAVDGSKVVHEEVFLDNPGSQSKRPVVFARSAPGPKDDAKAAAEVASAVGDAFAAGDQEAIAALVAPDVLFYDTELQHGVRGVDALLGWQSKTPEVELTNQEPISGPGWAVVRWTVRAVYPTGVEVAMPGATMLEVRHGKVARMTLYYDSQVVRLQD
jgi:ketosteroid isomerase-like protein